MEWPLQTRPGRKALFKDAAALYELAKGYFAWADANPWKKTELVKYQGLADDYTVDVGRPYSIDGLCTHLGVTGSYFRTRKGRIQERIEAKKELPYDEDVLYVIEFIEQIVRTQQFEGAMVGVFNASLTARHQGTADTLNIGNATGLRIEVRDQATADAMDQIAGLL